MSAVLHRGARSKQAERVQIAARKRLSAREIHMPLAADGVVGDETLLACRKAAWALGALSSTYERITAKGEIPVGVQDMIVNPGRRTDEQLERAQARISVMRAERARRAREPEHGQLVIVRNVLQAARNYSRNPGAYHYLAGGQANLVYLEPSPRSYRSDCSQFASAAQADSGLVDLGPNGPLWVNTVIMAGHLEVTDHPQPGDFGMYGSPPHHVEVYCGAAGGAGHEFVGHGSPPIDSLTPGRPDFYLRNPGATR